MDPEHDSTKGKKQTKEKIVPDYDRQATSEEDSDQVEESTRSSNVNLTQWTSKFTKYITALEDRIKELESKADVGGEVPIKKARRNRESTEIVQFFLASDEPRLDRGSTKDNRWKVKGTFMSEVDGNPLIRVLYRRTGADPEGIHELEQQKPSPGDIDILEIRINSKHIADFVDGKLEFEFSKHGLLHFTKPFRTLVRLFASIKYRLKKLERIHRCINPTIIGAH